MEVPRLGVESELQLPVYTTVTAMQDPSHICNLHRRLQQRRMLNPLSEARDQTNILVTRCGVLNPLSHNGNSNRMFNRAFLVTLEFYLRLQNQQA